MASTLINNKQKKVIHMAARKLGLIDRRGCKQQYKMVLINITGKDSSTKLTQVDYDKLGVWFNAQGINITSGAASSTPSAISSRQKFRIDKLMADLPGVNLAGVIHKITGDAMSLEELKPYEVKKVIDALEAIKKRQSDA